MTQVDTESVLIKIAPSIHGLSEEYKILLNILVISKKIVSTLVIMFEHFVCNELVMY